MPTQIIKSECDDREYKLVVLPNKMRVLLISDMEADLAGAAMNVHAGAALDPKGIPGVAHYLEHMLFMGTDKYPGENEYTEFIKNNGGYDNAFTSQEDTNYYFSISNEAFEEALDRLSQFFICPNFSESAGQREMNAVDSEYNMSLQSDARHAFILTKALSNKEGPYYGFQSGNLKSLDIPGIRDALLGHHKKWYSSNIMDLCIYGRFSIEQLEKWVVEKFSPVKNLDV